MAKAKKPLADVPTPHDDLVTRKRQFLEEFMTTGRVDLSCKKIGVRFHAPYYWAKSDEEFAKAWADAKQVAAQHLEDAAFRRATDGVQKPIYVKGELVGFEIQYADGLLQFLLKGLKPHVYRERVDLDHGGQPGNPVVVAHKGLTDERVEEIQRRVLGLNVPPTKPEEEPK